MKQKNKNKPSKTKGTPYNKSSKPNNFTKKGPGKKQGAAPNKARSTPDIPKSKMPNLYGMHAVREAWLNPERDVSVLYITEQAAKQFEDVIEAARRSGLTRPAPRLIEKQQIDKILPDGAVHQGIALCCSDAREYDIQDFIIKYEHTDYTVLAMLDQVTDPHNIGAILRSASAFGLDGVVMQKKHAPILDGVLAKTACGAVDHIPVAHATNLARAIEELQQNGFFVYGLDERGEKDINDLQQEKLNGTLPRKILIILGSEGSGLRRLVQESCDAIVKLPTRGAIASLNVSNAAAVAFYALSKKAE